jgi:phosphohistidine phosphatase SixA/8-oxo-dGTP pyrophosphatase MutT (NUDIX family)
VPSDPSPVTAAGGLLWRDGKNGIEVAVVHRPRYDDWSLPKGKSRPGEPSTVVAWREIAEETGYSCRLGRRLTTVRYPIASGPKEVEYYAAEALDGEFAPNREVDKLRWLTLPKARDQLTYEFDVVVLEGFALQPHNLTSLVLVRHARAGVRESWEGPDDQRPLDAKGRKQAAALAVELLPFAPAALHTAPLERCRATLAPLAKQLDLPVRLDESLTEEAYRHNPAAARHLVTRLAEAGEPVVLCSQGGVIPGVVRSLASQADVKVGQTSTPKSAYWVLTFDGRTMVQADSYPAPAVV